MLVLKIIFFLITGYYVFCTLYTFIYAVSGLFYKNPKYLPAKRYRKIAILVPAYKADNVIEELVENVLLQDYPLYDLIIIADSLKKDTLNRLETKSVKVIRFSNENRTKALAINTILFDLPDDYDVVLILDADNLIVERDYLHKINDAFESNIKALQTHRTAKNTNTRLALLDAVSEEINNHLFRRGHAALGLSSGLIGSGMAFDYALYKEQMSDVSSSGEDKELEMRLLKKHIRIAYADNLIILDEKIQQADSFVHQRARWIANQILQARNNRGQGVIQLFRGNFDFFNKVLQHFLLPRILLLSSVFLFTIPVVIFLPFSYSLWWILIAFCVCISMALSIPRRMYNKQLFSSMFYLPVGAMLMLISVFKTKGAAKKFHATEHGIISNPSNLTADGKRLKIAIEAQRIFRKNKHGMDFVILEIVRELQKMDTQNEYYIFVKPGEDICLTSSGNVRIIEIKCPFYVFWEQIALPGAVRKIKPDILHCTSSTAPLSINVPLILTLHDIIFMEKKYAGNKSLYQTLGRRYRRYLLPRILPKCKKIITVSDSEKQYIQERIKITPEQLTVVYNACSNRFRVLDDYRTVTQKYIDDESYILFLGNTDPKKNTLRVLVAYDLYIQQSENPLPLLILDIKEKHIDDYLNEAGIGRQIKKMLRFPGYVPNEDMPYIYNGARIFLYPSLHESFGIPILEAMSCGVPVITSNVSSMPEIGDDAALYVNPFHPEEISDQLLFLESHPEEREKMIGRGLQRYKAFSWERSTQKVLEVYENVYCTLN